VVFRPIEDGAAVAHVETGNARLRAEHAELGKFDEAIGGLGELSVPIS